MIKRCYKCKKNKTLHLFHKDKSKKDGLNSLCKKCNLKANKQRRNTRRQFVFDILKDCGGCIDCGEANISTLQFDHVKGKKIANVSWLVKNSNLNKIKKEILKCQIVCANCHAIRTSRISNWYANIKT